MLQFCIDDSKNGSDFVLGGYVATVEAWENFSDEWQELLADSGLTYLKGNTLTRVLRDLESAERDERLGDFGRLIKKHVKYGVDFSVSYADYKWFIRRARREGRRVDLKYKHPHLLGFELLLFGIAMTENARGNQERADCIFDMGIDKPRFLAEAYSGAYSSLPLTIRRMLTPDPFFRDDIDFAPLQAADLRAWYTHRALAGGAPKGRIWDELDSITHLPYRFDRSDLECMLRGMRLPTRFTHAIALQLASHLEGRGIRLPSREILK